MRTFVIAMAYEQILVRITGKDRIGLTAAFMEILARHDAQVLDIGQADIHSTLSLGILFRIDEKYSGQVMKDLLFKTTELGVQIGFQPIPDDEYEEWAGRQGRMRYILTVIGRSLSAAQIEAAAKIIAEQGLDIDSIKRLTGRLSIAHPERNVRSCIEFSLRGVPKDKKAMQKDLMHLSAEMGMDFSFQHDDMYRRMRRLICFDMDSTLIQTECIDELAERNGVGDQVRAITESAMRGEIDFKESFTRRVALLKGLDVSVMQDIAEHLPITEGADRLMSVLKTYGYKIAILIPAEAFRYRLCLCQRARDRRGRETHRPLCGRDRGRPPESRSPKAHCPDRACEPRADHRRGRRSQRPPDAFGSRPRHRLPRETARGGQRQAVPQHHRPGRRPVLPGLQGQQPGRAREDVAFDET